MKMKNQILDSCKSRYSALGVVVVFYLLSIIALSSYSVRTIPLSEAWGVLGFGLFIGALGSCTLFLLMQQWEEHIRGEDLFSAELVKAHEEIALLQHALTENKKIEEELAIEIRLKEEELQQLQFLYEESSDQIKQLNHEFSANIGSIQKKLEEKHVLLSEFQKTIDEQRSVILEKQKEVEALEEEGKKSKVKIKELIQEIDANRSFEEGKPKPKLPKQSSPRPVMVQESFPFTPQRTEQTAEKAVVQLKRCLDIAQKITGAGHFASNNPQFGELPVHNYALDLRRLFDSLRDESTCMIVVYSPKDDKILFANHQTKGLLGWSSEKLIQNFHEVIRDGSEEWRKGIRQLGVKAQSQIRLVMKSRSGQDLLVHCHLGMIPTGIFRNHVIGIMYR